jgi:hypothetical protein
MMKARANMNAANSVRVASEEPRGKLELFG